MTILAVIIIIVAILSPLWLYLLTGEVAPNEVILAVLFVALVAVGMIEGIL